MIAVGEAAPEFEARDSRGALFRLSEHRGHPVVLYFFPKAFTSGCTRETRQFGELAPSLAAEGVEVVGVSVDPVDAQARFATACRVPFLLVSDKDRAIARRYGVLSWLGVAQRVTFFLDPDGVVREVVAALRPGPHVAAARARHISGP